MKSTFLCEYLAYMIKCYSINQIIFFMYEWFWIPESYAIKQFMCLTDIQLTRVELS